jgi:hypothetical protein
MQKVLGAIIKIVSTTATWHSDLCMSEYDYVNNTFIISKIISYYN